MAPSKKITVQDAREWVLNALKTFDRTDLEKLDEVLNGEGSEDFIDTFRPESTSPKKKAPRPKKEIVPDAPYNAICCEARADKKDLFGFRINCQCTNRRPGDNNLCPTHQKKLKSKKGLELGLYTADRPENWSDGSPIIWSDASEEVKASVKKKPKRKVTCSHCGVVGHNKKGCPQLKALKENVEDNLEKKIEEKVEEKKVEEKKVEEKVEEKKVEKKVEVITGSNSAGDTYEVEVHTPVEGDLLGLPGDGDFEPEPEPEPEKVQEPEPEPLPSTDSQKTEELSYDCESDEDSDATTPLQFEGVAYELDADGTAVYDDDGDHVGNWDGEKVEFLNASWRKQHQIKMKEDADEEVEEPSLDTLDWRSLKKKAKELGVDPDKIEEASDLEGSQRTHKIIAFIQEKM